ncbi:sodium:calcium antiporter [Nakamurella silvestris]|nr:sodium:calcium antiporter [Nakamurella silvestris]
MALTIALLLISAIAIYLACEWFVNSVEWLGARMKVGTLAVGSVLAAVGTALPESVVTFVAVALGDTPERKDIGVGAAMGGPLVLSTIGYAVIGVVLAITTKSLRTKPPGARELISDQRWFIVIFIAKVALGLVVFAFKPWLAIGFVAAYAVFVWRELKEAKVSGGHSDEDLEPLRLQPKRDKPSNLAVITQTVATLAVIFVASQVFVTQLEDIGPDLGLPPTVVALLLAPIATELPEILNAVIWVRQGKTELAIANISGSMMIQATIPSALGIAFTPWHFDGPLILAGAVTLGAILLMVIVGRMGRMTAATLSSGALLYGGFLTAVLVTV